MINMLKPAISLMNRLKYGWKFLIIGTILMISIIIFTYQLFLFTLEDANFRKTELIGSYYISKLVALMSHAQEFRQLDLTSTNGTTHTEKKIKIIEDVINAEIDNITQMKSVINDNPLVKADWDRLKKQWKKISENYSTVNPQIRFEQDTQFIQGILDLILHTADISNLTLDPDIDSFYLMQILTIKIPILIESISTIRELTTDNMMQQNSNRLIIAKIYLQTNIKDALFSLKKVRKGGVLLYPGYVDMLKQSEISIQEYIAMTNEAIGINKISPLAMEKIQNQSAVLLNKMYALYADLSHEMESIIKNRISVIMDRFLFNMIISFISVSILIYLMVGFYYSIRQSMHEQNRIVKELESAKDAAFEASRAKSIFLANISHELRTPLSAIIGYSELLQDETADAPELKSFSDDLGKIHHAGNMLLQLINDILDISKIEAGKMEVFLEETHVKDIIDNIRKVVAPLTAKNNNQFQIQASDEMFSLVMQTDKIKLEQCLLNLIGNACKFTKDGVITLTLRTDKSDFNKLIYFEVRDTGIGLSSEHISLLFRPFSQADQGSNQYAGTGLGLYITRCYAIMLGGDVTVSSRKNEGSVFTIQVPLITTNTQINEVSL